MSTRDFNPIAESLRREVLAFYRERGEEISGPQDPGGRAGGGWTGKYGAIRTINTYLAALENSTDMSPEHGTSVRSRSICRCSSSMGA